MSLLMAQSGHLRRAQQCPLLGGKADMATDGQEGRRNLPAKSLWLEVGELYHLAPLRGFRRDEGTKFGRRTRKCGTAEFDQAGFDPRIGKAGIGLPVESLNDRRWRFRRRADA